MDSSSLREEANTFIRKAKQAESVNHQQQAVFYYTEAIDALHAILIEQQIANPTGDFDHILSEIDDLMNRAEKLKAALVAMTESRESEFGKPSNNAVNQDLELAKFIFERAMAADEQDSTEEAAALYIQSVELFLRVAKAPNGNPDFQTKARNFAKKAIERAEELKGVPKPETQPEKVHSQQAGEGGGGIFTREEIQVLLQTSILNGVKCLPFLPNDIREERFIFPLPFVDSELVNGVLQLSSKQASKLAGWARLSDLSPNPSVIGTLSHNAVKQTVVSDCSFVASLSVAAQCERKFKKDLISSKIFPQDRSGRPIYNPCGKYMIKLHLNGIWRKIVIDDQLPVDRHNRLLCSYSQNPSEFWVSLLEKAYMKVMGGYDFPGSNSSIDLNALTGWIPERLSIHSDVTQFDKLREFDRMFDRFHRGDCLITVATGELSDDDCERTGLVPSHAYAVLDIRKIDGLRLMMVKNPWSHLRWKGKFSENDSLNWTPLLQAKLGYDPRSARLNDNGIFWIDFDSLCHFYDVFYLSWNPDLFIRKSCVHETWLAGSGPRKDFYDMSGNPQFLLKVKSSDRASVWLVLTRHITDREDFARNREFITLLVYKVSGHRVYYPATPMPFMDGVRINSPHYLCKLTHDVGQAEEYTLVVSQFEKSNTLHFTLNAYGTCEFELTKIFDPYKPEFTRQLNGEWKGATAGGCSNHMVSYGNNPLFSLTTQKPGEVLVVLKGPRQYAVGFTVYSDNSPSGNTPSSFWSLPSVATSGAYRNGFTYIELKQLPSGTYLIVPTTFNAKEEGPFILEVKSSVPVTLRAKSLAS